MRKRQRLFFILFLLVITVSSFSQSSLDRQLYFTQLRAAEAYFRLNEIPDAKKMLAETDPKLRGWEWNFLNARTDRSQYVFRGHEQSVVGVAVSNDGKMLATGSADSKIILWNTEDGKEIKKIEGHLSQVTTLDFSPDGKWLVSGSTDKTLRLWDVSTGEELRNYNNEFSRGIYQVKFSPNGKKLGVVSWELSPGNTFPVLGFAKVLDVNTGKVLNRFDPDAHPVSAVDFSSDSKYLMTGSWGMFLDYFDLSSSKKQWNYDLNNLGYYAAIQSADISPNNKKILTAGKDSRVRIYNATDGKLLSQIEPNVGHNAIVNAARFSPDGSMFATAGDDGLLMVWETSSMKRLFTFRGHDGPINQLAWHPDGKRIYTSSFDHTVRMWNIENPGELIFDACINGPWDAPVTSDGTLIAAACSEKMISVWDLNKGKAIFYNDSAAANCAALSDDGKYFYSAGHDNMVRGFDIQKKKQLFVSKGHSNSIYGLDLCDKKKLVASAGSKEVFVWNMLTGDSIKGLRTVSNAYAVKFSPDGNELIAGLSNGKVYIYNTSSWQLIDSLQSGTSILFMDVDHSGKYLAISGVGGQVNVWDLKKRVLINKLIGHNKEIPGLSLHPSKPLLATASYDRNVKLWNVETGECLLTLGGFDQELYSVSFAKDGQRLVITETEGKIHVIDL